MGKICTRQKNAYTHTINKSFQRSTMFIERNKKTQQNALPPNPPPRKQKLSYDISTLWRRTLTDINKMWLIGHKRNPCKCNYVSRRLISFICVKEMQLNVLYIQSLLKWVSEKWFSYRWWSSNLSSTSDEKMIKMNCKKNTYFFLKSVTFSKTVIYDVFNTSGKVGLCVVAEMLWLNLNSRHKLLTVVSDQTHANYKSTSL